MSDELVVFSALKHPLKIGTKLDINKNMQQTIEIVDCKWNEQENMYVYKCLVLSGKNNNTYKTLYSTSPHYIRNYKNLTTEIEEKTMIQYTVKNDDMPAITNDYPVYNEIEKTAEDFLLDIYNNYLESNHFNKMYAKLEDLEHILYIDKNKNCILSYEAKLFKYDMTVTYGEFGKSLCYIPRQDNLILKDKFICYAYKDFLKIIQEHFYEYNMYDEYKFILENDKHKNLKIGDEVYVIPLDWKYGVYRLEELTDNLELQVKKLIYKNDLEKHLKKYLISEISIVNNILCFGVRNNTENFKVPSNLIYSVNEFTDNKDIILEKIINDVIKNNLKNSK